MYINFWYPIAKAQDVTGEEPFRTKVMGLDYVAFRDDQGQAHVLSDTCAHRGGALGKGWVRDNCIVCPYHGWRYSGDGKCTEIPSLGEGGNPPARAKVDSYPVQEKYGIVFAFLGDLPEGERPPIYEIEEYGQEGWRESEVAIMDVDYYYERSVENGLDAAHNEFVHPTQGSPRIVQTEPMDIEDIPWGCKFFVAFAGRDKTETELKDLRNDSSGPQAGSGHQGPNTLVTWIQFSATNRFHQYLFEAPVDDGHTRLFFLNMRNCMLDEALDDRIQGQNLKVAGEDIAILEELRPVRTPETNTKEILLPADQVVVRYRDYLKEWQNNGWRVDYKAMKANEGDVAYAVPSPARREAGNWVLDPVPLMGAK